MKINKECDLAKLEQELAAAGITHNALGTSGDELFTYSEIGERMELPPEAQAVIDAHIPPPKPPATPLEERLFLAEEAINFLLMM